MSDIFPQISKQIISMITSILGYYSDEIIDSYILGVMASIFPTTLKPLTKFDYSIFLANNIHIQLMEFHNTHYFTYQSHLAHLFMYSQSLRFQHLQLQIDDGMGNPNSVIHSFIHYTSIIINKVHDPQFYEFANMFISQVYEIIYFQSPPRIFLEIHRMLQLRQDKRTCDQFLSENHIVIKVYGSELQPYLIPKFLTLRVF